MQSALPSEQNAPACVFRRRTRMNDIADSDPQTLFNHVAERLSAKSLAYLHVIEGDTVRGHVPPFDYKNLKNLFGGIVIGQQRFSIKSAPTRPSRMAALTS